MMQADRSPSAHFTPKPLERAPSPVIKAAGLAHTIFEKPDLDRLEAFLLDFGLTGAARTADALYMRGAGPAHHIHVARKGSSSRFIGLALRAERREDLDRIAAVPGASAIERIEEPGGGERVVLFDPHGFRVEVIHGQSLLDPLPVREPLPINTPFRKPRVNTGQRAPDAPPAVVRLGHAVLEVVDFLKAVSWYMSHFGFIPSDVLCLPDGSPVGAFLRLDRGDEPTDHHTLMIASSIEAGHNHSAYELVDLDAVGLGHRLLAGRGYRTAWGIGRHLLGSQVFDYWRDPWGDKVEHYADGDVFDSRQPTGYHLLTRDSQHQWGPDFPADFVDARMTPRKLVRFARNLARHEELTVGRAIQLKRAMGV